MSSKLTKLTAAVLIFLGVYINIPFSILGSIFDYPQILRQPTSEVLLRFHQGGVTLIAVWYAFALCPILMIAAAKLLHRVLRNEHKDLASVAATFGVLAGVFQVLGLIRWVFVVPALANAYTDSNATDVTRSAAIMVFQGFHQYAGVAIGEHLSQLFTALWILLISFAILRSAVFRRWQGFAGIAISAMLLLGLIDGFATVLNFDAKIFSLLTVAGFILLSLWMISLGVILLWKSGKNSEPV
jgi:hypothetical protein